MSESFGLLRESESLDYYSEFLLKRLLSAIITTALFSSALPAQNLKLAKELQNLSSTGTIPVIVQWRNAGGTTQENKITNLGGANVHHFGTFKGGLYQLPASALQTLASDPDVAFVSPNRPIAAKLDNTAAAVNAAAAWGAGFFGSGVGIAVIDSGVNADPNLGTGRAPVYGYDFTQPTAAALASNMLANTSSPLPAGTPMVFTSMPAPDQFGHGQHVAGIIASNGSASICPACTRAFVGIAPAANIIDLKVLDSNGQGTDSNVILAIETAIALKNIYNIRVINLSVGRPVYESYTQDPLCQAVEAAWKAGIVVVAAAGNDGRDNTFGEEGYGTINAPGNDPYVITVGAMKTEGTYTRSDDLVASYSSKGPTAVDHISKPDLVAPGNLVVSLLVPGSTLAKQNSGNIVTLSYYETVNNGQAKKLSNSYFVLSGTSMATPVVSGAAADLLQANPKLTPDQVKAILMQTAYKTFPSSSSVTDATSGQTFVDYYDAFTVGAGYLDLGAAMTLAHASLPAGTAMSPVAQQDPNSGNVSLIFDPSSIWSDRSMWGTQSIWAAQNMWGSSVLNSNQVIWNTQSAWGAASPDASRTMWGARSMWGAGTTSSSQSDAASRTMWGANVSVQGEN